MKAAGSEIQEFFRTGWPQGWYQDDFDECLSEVLDDDASGLDPHTKYDLDSFGVLCPEPDGPDGGKEYVSFALAFRRWRKSKATITSVVEVPKARYEEFLEAVKRFGGKVV